MKDISNQRNETKTKYYACQIVNTWDDSPTKTYTFVTSEEKTSDRGYAFVGKNNRLTKVKLVKEVKKPFFECKEIVLIF